MGGRGFGGVVSLLRLLSHALLCVAPLLPTTDFMPRGSIPTARRNEPRVWAAVFTETNTSCKY